MKKCQRGLYHERDYIAMLSLNMYHGKVGANMENNFKYKIVKR
jgi:hypothetical protein